MYSTSKEEDGALICCVENEHQSTISGATSSRNVLVSSLEPHWWDSLSYEGYLCNQKIKSLPLSKSITQFPDSWILPVIPIMLRIIIWILNKALGQISMPSSGIVSPHDFWTSFKRLLFHFSIMMFRGWGLYVYMNMLEDIVLTEFQILPSINSFGNGSCWYSHLIWEPRGGGYIDPLSPKLNDECYGQVFDFSDHVVLFFSHSFPSLIFEGLFCVLFPFYPIIHSSRRRKDSDSDDSIHERETVKGLGHHYWLHLILNLIVPIILFVGFIYLNILTLLALHSTVAYFHSTGEVIVGYLISLLVQYPIGMIICSKKLKWKKTRHFVGYPID